MEIKQPSFNVFVLPHIVFFVFERSRLVLEQRSRGIQNSFWLQPLDPTIVFPAGTEGQRIGSRVQERFSADNLTWLSDQMHLLSGCLHSRNFHSALMESRTHLNAKTRIFFQQVHSRRRDHACPWSINCPFIRWRCTIVCNFLSAATVMIRIALLWATQLCSAACFLVFLPFAFFLCQRAGRGPGRPVRLFGKSVVMSTEPRTGGQAAVAAHHQ